MMNPKVGRSADRRLAEFVFGVCMNTPPDLMRERMTSVEFASKKVDIVRER